MTKPMEMIKRLVWTALAAGLAALALHLSPGNDSFPITVEALQAAGLATFTAFFGALTIVARDMLAGLDDGLTGKSAATRIVWTFIQAAAGGLAAMTILDVSGLESALYAGISAAVTAASLLVRAPLQDTPVK